jgi:glycosyltransferase involved in cell wall biosynthesis
MTGDAAPRPDAGDHPAYNEERHIGAVVRGVRAALPRADVLVVDDGSHDRTRFEAAKRRRARRLARLQPGLRRRAADRLQACRSRRLSST